MLNDNSYNVPEEEFCLANQPYHTIYGSNHYSNPCFSLQLNNNGSQMTQLDLTLENHVCVLWA